MDKKGVVRTVSGNTCTVYLYDEKRDVSVSINNVDPGEPAKQDKVCLCMSQIRFIVSTFLNGMAENKRCTVNCWNSALSVDRILRLDFQPFWESGLTSSSHGWKLSLSYTLLRRRAHARNVTFSKLATAVNLPLSTSR